MQTLYWHDYETWGADPSIDRPSQFAGVRTNLDLELVSEPLVEYCVPCVDVLPNAEACLVTGITPQQAMEEGLPEYQFAQKILAELSKPGTCGVGYNSIRFDDEVTRFLAFRNFHDPYEREWKNGNSRWDIIDMVRLCFALRPETLAWPEVDGRPSLKLENLSVANGITHTSAHDAYSDVEATIELAKLIKQRQPKLYDYCFNLRNKTQTAALIDVKNKKPLLHISSLYSVERGCAALVAPLAFHPVNKNAVIAIDLSFNVNELLTLSADELKQRVFTNSEQLPEGQERIPLSLIHLNKSPVIATSKLLDNTSAERLAIDKTVAENNWRQLLSEDLTEKLQALYRDNEFEQRTDPERKLYDGFIANADKSVMQKVRRATAEQLNKQSFIFEDARLEEILFRYRARNFPYSLAETEQFQWLEFCQQRLRAGGDGCQSYTQLKERVSQLRSEYANDDHKLFILSELEDYADQVNESLNQAL